MVKPSHATALPKGFGPSTLANALHGLPQPTAQPIVPPAIGNSCTPAELGAAFPTIGNSCKPADIVAFHHAAFFSPAISTLTTALEKNYIPHLPGLTTTLLRKYTPDLEATAMGHLDNRRKNIQSTKPKRVQFGDTDADDPFPAQPTDGYRTHTCFLAGSEPKSIVYRPNGQTPAAIH
jgi:hypothetical protein